MGQNNSKIQQKKSEQQKTKYQEKIKGDERSNSVQKEKIQNCLKNQGQFKIERKSQIQKKVKNQIQKKEQNSIKNEKQTPQQKNQQQTTPQIQEVIERKQQQESKEYAKMMKPQSLVKLVQEKQELFLSRQPRQISSYQTEYQLIKKIDQQSQIVSKTAYIQSTQVIQFKYYYKKNGVILNLQQTQPRLCYTLIEELQDKCSQYLPYLFYQLIYKNLPTQQQIKYTKKKSDFYQTVLENYKKYEFGNEKCQVPMILLKYLIQKDKKNNCCLNFQEEEDIRTTLSIKSIFTGFMSDYIVFRQKQQEDDIFQFRNLANPNQKQLRNLYVQTLKKKLSLKYQAKTEEIYVFQLKKGSIDSQCAIKKQLFELFKMKEVSFSQLFSQYRLSQRNFDPSKNNKFQQWLNQQDLLIRGGFPYYPPVYCKRYALNVSNKYQNNNWLSHQKKKLGVWAVGMHGSFIHAKISPTENVIQSMMSGFSKSQMLIIGQHHVYQPQKNCRGKINSQDHEHQSGLIGKGIYLTPYYQLALKYGTYNQKNISKLKKKENFNHQQNQLYWDFSVVIQARIHPKYIRIPLQKENQNIWVIPESKYIRPYGILVSLKSDFEKQLDYLCNQKKGVSKNYEERYVGVRYKKQKSINNNGQEFQFNPYEFDYYSMRQSIQSYCQKSFPNQE